MSGSIAHLHGLAADGSRPATPAISARQLRNRRAAIIGCAGVPASYGGFETLAEQLAIAAEARGIASKLTIWCSSRGSAAPHPGIFRGARLRHLPLSANGASSIPYDGASALAEMIGRGAADTVLALGVSGGGPLAALAPLSSTRLVVHVDGREAERAKWGGTARRVLAWSERRAVRAADVIVADNAALARDISERYGCRPQVIAYGAEHARQARPGDISDLGLPARYALAIARAEPENNLETVIRAFARLPDQPLVIVANWSATRHGRLLRAAWEGCRNLHLLEAEYDPARLRAIRDRAWLYLHGHSAGGTNPSLVEMMPFGVPILAWDCAYNRASTAGSAPGFRDADGLIALVRRLATRPDVCASMGAALATVAARRYRWDAIADAYFDLLDL
jgi:glycosyltransferase involved in cell wall biosynthesis